MVEEKERVKEGGLDRGLETKGHGSSNNNVISLPTVHLNTGNTVPRENRVFDLTK